MERRVQMLLDWETGAFSVSELSRRYGVSRDTVYLWTGRREGAATTACAPAPSGLRGPQARAARPVRRERS